MCKALGWVDVGVKPIRSCLCLWSAKPISALPTTNRTTGRVELEICPLLLSSFLLLCARSN